jgi:2-dehydro-3-deoxygluconokinase
VSVPDAPPPAGGLVTLGETMGLLNPTEVGPLHHAPEFRMTVAGAESNVAIAARRLGVPATWIGKVGDDEVGDLIERELRAEDVRTLALRAPDAPTGLMLKTRRIGHLTSVTYYRAGSAGARLETADLDEDVIAAASVLHLTGITPALGAAPAAAVRAAIEIARAHDVPISFDVNYRARLWAAPEAGPVLRDLVKQVDVVFASEHEAALLSGAHDESSTPHDPDDLARRLAELGPGEVVIKRGARGCVALVDGEWHRVDALRVQLVDPVGAGDAFVGGYLAELVSGRDAATRLRTATAAGAFAVGIRGDWEGLPRRHELALLTSADDVVR